MSGLTLVFINVLLILMQQVQIEKPNDSFVPEKLLSQYQFFEGELNNLVPSANVYPYDLNTPLFSDYAWKKRFIYLPEGTAMGYEEKDSFNFPLGSILIKNFYYPIDFRKPEKGRRIIETRLLVRSSDSWESFPYVWNEEQTDATLEIAGGMTEVIWKDENGKKQKIEYIIPNKNQCKGCHNKNETITPIGPAARHLNRKIMDNGSEYNQLIYWSEQGLLEGLPELSEVMKNADWKDQTSTTLDQRARAYLDINCGHCHNQAGDANTSGLKLDIFENDPFHLGINKSPIAAGKGSGNFDYDISPGKPEESILVYRMKSNDPGIRMPEIGRSIMDEEGVKLISEWIRNMENN